ncbi:MAG: ABC transporter ATP-binding protein [Clostridia bacterium]|nr:ABC transporter ATP-binding protein [Clostridia bacterium]
MKRWLKYVKPYKLYFIFGPLMMIVEVIGEMMMPKMLAMIIDYGIEPGKMEEAPDYVRWIFGLFGEQASPFIIAIMVGMILTAIIMMIGGVGGAYFGSKASVNFAADLREDLYRKVQTYSFSNIDRYSTGSLITRLTNDVTQLQNFVSMLLRMCLRAPGMLIGALIMALTMNLQLSLVLLVTIPLLGIFLWIVISKSFPRFGLMQTKIDRLNSTVQENLTNVRVVKSFVRESFEKAKFAAANAELKETAMSAMKVMIFMLPAMHFFMNATTIAVLWFGGQMVLDGSMGPGDLTAFVTYITQILSSLMMVSMMIMFMSRAIASGRRIAEVLDETPDISDGVLSGEDRERTVRNGEIEFRNVSFRYYKNSEEKVLDGISLRIPPSSTVGIIGSTGCGKTTLVSLIARFYDADEGEVLVDGVDVHRFSLFNLREGIGMVLQNNVLFSGSIEDNLRWGNADATEEEIREMASYAQADGFISSFKEGYQTELGQGGNNVSGGQKQRLCIARALLKKPKILILDDSTSAVDTATEARIRTAFRTELKDSTKIIIAQRISSVMEADRIIVMNDGKITGEGTHEELLASNLEYQEIYNSQMEAAQSPQKGVTA